MARRSMKAKIQPAVMKFNFNIVQVNPGANGDYNYIDLSQCASLLNRRFYRQGLNWAVSSIKLLTPSGDAGAIGIHKLPNTWIMSNAWEKSFRAWQQMIKNATDDAGSQSIKGKFLDFKIFANNRHHSNGVSNNLLPFDSEGNIATPGQWQMSDITIPSTIGSPGTATDYELIAVGPNNPGAGPSGKDAKSVIQGYADSRALPNIDDPNVPTDASLNWIMSIFNEGTQQDNAVTNMLEVTGDKAPYPFENDGTNLDTMYPGGETQLPGLEVHDVEYITSTTVGSTTHIDGGNFPCGLLEVRTNFPAGTSMVLEVTMVPGSHRGYLAETMTEM